mgnify:FL=1
MDIKQKLQNGQSIKGCMISELYTPNLSRMFYGLNFDFLLLDCEHGYFDMTQVANLIAVGGGYDFPILVRVGQNSSHTVIKYLDMGARGILLANVANARQVRELVQMCLYAPDGDRGVSTFRAHTGYRNHDVPGLMRRANEQNMVIAQIESLDSVHVIDDIVSIKGLDGVLIGPNDLTQHMGIFGQYDHPETLKAIEKVAVAAAVHNKWSGVITANEKLLRFCAGLGMQFFSVGSELSMLAQGAKVTLEKITSITG